MAKKTPPTKKPSVPSSKSKAKKQSKDIVKMDKNANGANGKSVVNGNKGKKPRAVQEQARLPLPPRTSK